MSKENNDSLVHKPESESETESETESESEKNTWKEKFKKFLKLFNFFLIMIFLYSYFLISYFFFDVKVDKKILIISIPSTPIFILFYLVEAGFLEEDRIEKIFKLIIEKILLIIFIIICGAIIYGIFGFLLSLSIPVLLVIIIFLLLR